MHSPPARAPPARYSDVIVNPTHWKTWRGKEFRLIDALSAGLDEAAQDGLCEVGIAYSLLRTQSEAEARDIVEAITANRPARLIALSVDGDEQLSGPTGQKFHAAFSRAAAAGLHRTVHAGESSRARRCLDAIDLLHAERIDHGIRAIEDPALIERLVRDQISLGVCPRSNLALGIYPDWPSHPLRRLLDAGVRVTLNTDDPAPLGTTLEADWAVAAEQFDLTFSDLIGFAQRSIEASFAPTDLKRDLLAELSSHRGSAEA